MFIDYLLLKFYLSDLIILAILGLFFWQACRNGGVIKKIKIWMIKNKWLTIFSLLLLSRQIFTPNLIGVFSWIKILEMLVLAKVLIDKQLFTNKLVINVVSLTLIFQSLLAIYQSHFQKHLWGFIFFGEPILTNSIGLAKISIDGVEKILPYGTTAHPNILAAVTLIYLFFLLQLIKDKKIKISLFSVLTFSLSLITLWLTRSISAWSSLGIIIWLLLSDRKVKKYLLLHLNFFLGTLISIMFLVPVLIHFTYQSLPDNLSLVRRETLNQAAMVMIFDHPILGVGMNNFVVNLEKYALTKEVVRFIQPVHHVGLLWLSQTGLLGVIWLISLGQKMSKQIKISLSLTILVLLPILSLDHYLLTIQTGMILMALTVGLINQTSQLIQKRSVKRSV